MAIWNFFQQAIRSAPNAARLPMTVAGVILCVVLLAFFCQFTLWWRYARFRRLTLRVSRRLADSPPPQIRDAIQEKAGPTTRGIGAILLGMIDSVSARRANFRPESAIEAIDHGENQNVRAAFVRWVSSTALVMGLAGTFFAFVQLIAGSGLLEALANLGHAPKTGNLSPQLADSYAQLSTAFGNVYQALGYAFLSSLAGLLGTILLSFIGSIFVQPAKARALLVLGKFAEGLHVVDATATDQTENLVTALNSAAAALTASGQTIDSLHQASAFLESAASRFENAEQTNAQLATTLATLATELHTSHQKWDVLVDALRESKQRVGDTLEEFRKEAVQQRELTNSTVASAVAEMREITDVLAKNIKEVSAAKMDDFVKIQEELREALVETKRDWEKAGEAIVAQTSVSFEAALKTVSETVANSRYDAARAQQEMATLAKENLEAVGTIIAGGRADALETQEKMAGIAAQNLEAVSAVVAQGRDAATQAQQKMAEVASQATGVVTQHQTVLAQHAQAVTASLDQWSNAPATMEQTLASTVLVINKLSASLDRLTRMPEQWEKTFGESIRRLESQLDAHAKAVQPGIFARWRTIFEKATSRRQAK